MFNRCSVGIFSPARDESELSDVCRRNIKSSEDDDWRMLGLAAIEGGLFRRRAECRPMCDEPSRRGMPTSDKLFLPVFCLTTGSCVEAPLNACDVLGALPVWSRCTPELEIISKLVRPAGGIAVDLCRDACKGGSCIFIYDAGAAIEDAAAAEKARAVGSEPLYDELGLGGSGGLPTPASATEEARACVAGGYAVACAACEA